MTVNEIVETFRLLQEKDMGNYQVSWSDWRVPKIIKDGEPEPEPEPEPVTFFIMPQREDAPIKVVYEDKPIKPVSSIIDNSPVIFWENKGEDT